MEESIKEAGLEEVEAYFLRRQNVVAQYIVKRLNLYVCQEAVQRLGVGIVKRW